MQFMTYFFDNRFPGLGLIQGQPKDRFGNVQKVLNPSLSDFDKRIFTSNVRDMRNLIPAAFVSIKMSFWLPNLAQLKLANRTLKAVQIA